MTLDRNAEKQEVPINPEPANRISTRLLRSPSLPLEQVPKSPRT